MTTPIKLIVGLGNPGPEYVETRHNAGFWLIDEIARAFGGSLQNESKFHGETARVLIDGRDVRLLKPMKFMNRSGLSVASLANFFKIPVESILVAHDEMDFDAGIMRLKKGGGHGGHNGLRDIIAQMGNQKDFMRLRMGIGHPGHASKVTGYVLGKPSVDDRISIERGIDDAMRVLPSLLSGDVQKAMNELHTKSKG
jgi:PTH1 family peptidyl-tRNA hydrolase